MSHTSGSAHQLVVAYIGGGSRGWAWGFMKDLAQDPSMGGTLRLYDIDQDAAEKNLRIGQMIASHPQAKSTWRYEQSPSLEQALSGADFVVISILPGTFKEMHSDVHAPEAYGIYQSVGDTVGPGGIIRAVRTIPMFERIAQAIRDVSPEAWVINYTNPMSVCMRTLYEVFPNIKAFGCCHEVFGTQKLLAQMVAHSLKLPLPKREDIAVGVTGINHFTWLYSASYQGHDLFPIYENFVDEFYETGFHKDRDEHWMNSYFECTHRVKFDLFRRYGLMAAAGDRHLAEFMPAAYLRSPEAAHHWGFSLTPVSWRDEDLARRLQRQAALLSGEEPMDMKASGEEGHLLIRALLGLQDMVSNVNIPNRGQIPNLKLGSIVETNALFRRDEIAPLVAPELKQGIETLVTRHMLGQDALVTAVLQEDWRLLRNVFLNDPQLDGLSPDKGETLFKEMLINTSAFVPQGLMHWLT